MLTQQKKRKILPIILSILAAALLALGGYFVGVSTASRQPVSASATGTGAIVGLGQAPPYTVSDVEFKQFWTLWELLKQKFYQQPVQDKSLFYGAMAGLAESLNDPYTVFFEPKTAADFQTALSGQFEGIGAELGLKDGAITIVAPLPETPAERAGLLAGDVITKIDGQDAMTMTLDKAVSLIRGPHGTKVTLTIFRLSLKKPAFDVVLTREQIQVKSVTQKMLPGRIALITVSHFNEDTQKGFTDAVTAVLKNDPKGVILDLRNNPGGFLDTALSMAGEWTGDVVVVKERRPGKITEELHGVGNKRLHGIPTIVLVNVGSASASEIVAGALQDLGDAKLLGMKTYGKGSVQDYQNFTDGSGIKITIAEWLTPKDRTINKTGLDPDIIVDRTPEDYAALRDPQLDRAVGILNGTATPPPAGGPSATSTH